MDEEFKGVILSRKIIHNYSQYPSKECVIDFIGDGIRAKIAVIFEENIKTLEKLPLHKTCEFTLHDGEYIKILSDKKHHQKTQKETRHLYSIKQVEHALKTHTNLGHYSIKKFPDDDIVVYYKHKHFGNFPSSIVNTASLSMLATLIRESIDAYENLYVK